MLMVKYSLKTKELRKKEMNDRIREILSWYTSENPGIRTNLARMLNHGRLAGTGKMVILPVDQGFENRKSTRLNSSHTVISYAVFCLKKKRIKLICITST